MTLFIYIVTFSTAINSFSKLLILYIVTLFYCIRHYAMCHTTDDFKTISIQPVSTAVSIA